MSIKIALAGNPNCGKTTLFNALTGSNQFVGNWPGVTVEKKEGKLKKHEDVIITDLPGIYSLSPYTLEEVVARNYLIGEKPDVILNIVDATNLERNLYLTTQLVELGIPVVIALNMMDVVRKTKDVINTKELAKRLGCKIVEISALKSTGIEEAAEVAIKAAKEEHTKPMHTFSGVVEHALAHIEEAVLHDQPEEKQRWYAIKIFERDDKVLKELNIPEDVLKHIEQDIVNAEEELDDDSESIITNERYVYIAELLQGCYKKKKAGQMTVSDKIDRIVTNRWLALPIFMIVMFIVYFVSVTTVGTWVTDWTNDCLFGDGFHFLGIGSGPYSTVDEAYSESFNAIDAFTQYGEENNVEGFEDAKNAMDVEADGWTAVQAKNALWLFANKFEEWLFANKFEDDFKVKYTLVDEETLEETEVEYSGEQLKDGIKTLSGELAIFVNKDGEVNEKKENKYNIFKENPFIAPDPADFGAWVPGIPVLATKGLEAIHCWDWLQSLIVDGIIAGLGAILGFVPQILVLFIFLALLEMCGYMSRIAFVLDRIFRKFGLSGKSFIPMLIGTGCGVPGIMASRTIENERDRRMTIMTTTFIPCSAKLPFIALMAGAIFGGAWWVAPSAYFLGMFAIIASGIMLKKTKAFAGDPAPFVMELPAYHLPTIGNVLHSMWERGWSFIKKAGTIILLSTIVIWFTTFFGFVDGKFGMLEAEEIEYSILAYIGKGLKWIFAPLGFGTWQATVATVTGLVAKENIVGTLGIVYGASGSAIQNIGSAFTTVSGYSFLIFNLLCAPCFAAMGAMKREMNNGKWTAFAILYQCGFAYAIALIFNQFGNLFTGHMNNALNIVSLIFAVAAIAVMVYMLVKPYKEAKTLTADVKVK